MKTISGFGFLCLICDRQANREEVDSLSRIPDRLRIRSTSHHAGGGEGAGLTTKETLEVFRERTYTPRSCSLPVLQILFLPLQKKGSVLSGGDKPERIYTLIPN